MRKEGIGKIKVMVTREKENIRVTIEDDGVGIIPDRKANNQNQSLGMKLISERMALLERLSGQVFSISVIQLQDNEQKTSGTRITIIAPANPDEQVLSNVR